MLRKLEFWAMGIFCDDQRVGASDAELHLYKWKVLVLKLSLKLSAAETRVGCNMKFNKKTKNIIRNEQMEGMLWESLRNSIYDYVDGGEKCFEMSTIDRRYW